MPAYGDEREMPSADFAYCDESGQRNYGLKTDPYFAIAAAVDGADAPQLEDEIRGIKRALWEHPEIKLKSKRRQSDGAPC